MPLPAKSGHANDLGLEKCRNAPQKRDGTPDFLSAPSGLSVCFLWLKTPGLS
jgi:hypothetical protein